MSLGIRLHRETVMSLKALFVGNSDGIGLAMTKRLLGAGWEIMGVSQSVSPIESSAYRHEVADAGKDDFTEVLRKIIDGTPPDLCIYFAGICEFLNPLDMEKEARMFEVNLTGMVRTATAVIPGMVQRRHGHFIGLSSMADEFISPEAPSYSASKAGFSNYLGGLARALKPRGVFVTNVRFGYVDTKMAKDDAKPFLMSIENAVDHLMVCLYKKPVTYSAPKIMIPIVKALKLFMKLKG